MIKNDALPFFTFDNFFMKGKKNFQTRRQRNWSNFQLIDKSQKNLIEQDMNLSSIFG